MIFLADYKYSKVHKEVRVYVLKRKTFLGIPYGKKVNEALGCTLRNWRTFGEASDYIFIKYFSDLKELN